MGLAGQSAGIDYAARSGTVSPPTSRAPSALQPLNLGEFLKLELPPRRLILTPWLSEKGTAMIYSPRGVGKTLLGLSAGYAAASGDGFLGWSAPAPRRVLYVDGETTAAEMQHRLAAIVAGFTGEAAPDYFRMLSADVSERGLPDLATPDGQREFDDAIGNAELAILDNISTLCRSGKENEAEGWQSVQDWALSHRRAGRSLIFAHHAGKGGNQRGTSKREDVLDTVIALRRPQDYRPEDGARFEVHFEKHRSFFGSEAEPFEARYEKRDGAAIWTQTAIADVDLKRVADAIREGKSIRETATDLGMNKSKVERLRAKAKEQGLLND
jgi:putative DNA primase/helicase